MIWDGPDGVNVSAEGGEVFNNVHNGDVITFSTPEKDTDLTLSGAVSGTSRFHVSCSDPQMNGPEDCGSAQGNGKKDENALVNDWLLEGMAGSQALVCTPPIPDPTARDRLPAQRRQHRATTARARS